MKYKNQKNDLNLSKKEAKCYQPLYDYMVGTFDIILLPSEMEDILRYSEIVTNRLCKLYMVKCDVVKCNLEAVTGGIYMKEKGYVCLCSEHSNIARKNPKELKLKKNIRQRKEKK